VAFSNIDRALEVDSCCDEISVKSTDYCCHFVKHPYTILQRKECWTCCFSNFGSKTGSITDTGICRFHKEAANGIKEG
jgi:hypothetical protein